jgi:hypothetical protein
MKLKLFIFLLGISISANHVFACSTSPDINITINEFLLCDGHADISVLSRQHGPNDYIELELQRLDNGNWVGVQNITSQNAQAYGTSGGTCYDIEETFQVNPVYVSSTYRVVVIAQRFDNITGKFFIVWDYTSDPILPGISKPIVLESLTVVDNENKSVAWVSDCISEEFDLSVSAVIGETYAANYVFNVYEADANGNILSQISSVSGSGENMGRFGQSGDHLLDWVNTVGKPDFYSGIASMSNGGYLLLELLVENEFCTNLPLTNATQLIEVRSTPYITSFYFEWDDDNDPFNALAVVQPSQNISNPVSIGGVSGELVSDISTSYFDEYTVTLERDLPFVSWTPIAQDNVQVSGTQFRLNPNSITLLPTFTNNDMPLFNPGEIYKVFLTVETAGCPSSTNWSFYSVDPNNVLNKMGQLNLAENTTEAKYHYVNSEEATLNLMGFDGDASSYIFEVYNLTGQKQLQSTSSVLNISTLPKSAYLVVAKNEQGLVYQEKFVW